LSVGTEVAPQKGDWAFGISHRGKTRPTLKGLEICDKAGAFTLLVGGQGIEGQIAELPYVKYYLPTSPQEKCEPHTIAVSSAICAITTLMLGMRSVEEWDALRSIGDPNLELLRQRAGKGPNLILGEWEGEWLAREGALKLMEMAKLPVRAFSTEEFFHGPKHSTSDDESIWHVSLAKDARNSEVKSDYRVDVRGGSPMSWMPALVELQWLSLAVALNRGMNPDGV
jgi:fructoselysine-6-P-deglycase FrlB-like protein